MVAERKKNLLATVLFALLSWGTVGFFVFFVDPEIIRDFPIAGTYLPFFLFLFAALFLTSAILLANTRRGFLVACGVVGFLYLRLWELGHVLNAVLLVAFLISLELAFSTRR